jgi:menaquinone-dependent protoporphyrinogen oxidase
MGKVLVVYGTGTGCTAEIAERIGTKLTAMGLDAEVVAAKDAPAPGAHDAVFVGSGVRAGSWHQPVKEWVAANAGALGDVPVAFFTACLTMAQDPSKIDAVRAYTDPLIAETGVQPVSVGAFAGMNEPRRFSFVERTIMKLMKAPAGDFRDWDAIDAWTAQTAAALGLVA